MFFISISRFDIRIIDKAELLVIQYIGESNAYDTAYPPIIPFAEIDWS